MLFHIFKISGQIKKILDNLWISGHFRTGFKISGISGQRSGLNHRSGTGQTTSTGQRLTSLTLEAGRTTKWNWNETVSKLFLNSFVFCFSQKTSWNDLAVLANHCRYTALYYKAVYRQNCIPTVTG